MPKFSIISPVYKVEPYLRRCIDSILVQTYEDWELILVDDGSPDNSGNICDEYALKDSRIRVLHKTNGGVSSARNLGLQETKGEWVLFVDSDDKIERFALATIAEAIEKQPADLFIYSIKEVIDEKKSNEHHYPLTINKVYNKQEVEQELIPFACKGSSFINSPCNKAYRLSIIKDNNILFQNRIMGEDWLFNVEYIQHVDSAIYIDKLLYNYMRNGESASSKYIPEQFCLWQENWQTKMGLIHKYHLSVDINQMKREMYMKVYYFHLEIKKKEQKASSNQKISEIKSSTLIKEALKALPTNLRELRAWLTLIF